MTILIHSYRATLRALWVPLLGSLALCYLGVRLAPIADAGTGANHGVGQWLHVPGLLLVAASLAAVLEHWPLFSRARPGADHVRRIESGPLNGCVHAALGSLAALLTALALAAITFDVLVASLGIERGTVTARLGKRSLDEAPYLDRMQTSLRFRVDGDEPVAHVQLRPVPVLGAENEPANLRILADGQPLHDAAFLPNQGQTITLRLEPPRAIRELTVERGPGRAIVLGLPDDRVDILSARQRSSILNAVFALLSYLVPACLALGLMALGHVHLSLPVNLLGGVIATLLATLLEFTPSAQAITAYARGQWLLGDSAAGLLSQGATVTAIAGALLVPAAILGRFSVTGAGSTRT